MADLQTAFLMSMAVVIAVAAVIVILFHRFKQPMILGYLLAGILVGPFITSMDVTDPSGADIEIEDILNLLASLGIVLLTFSIGLEFSLRQLRKIGFSVIAAATLEIAIMIIIGYQLGIALGWSTFESSLLGAMLSIASTMVIVRALKESGGIDNERARLIVSLLVVEDIAAVIILASVSGLVTNGSLAASDLGVLLLKIAAFIVTSIVIGVAVVPRLVDYVGRQRSNELLVITVLGLAFSMAYFSKWIGFSEAIGAFVMGVIVSESKYVGDVIRRVEPVRDLFVAMFFITVGMLVNFAYLNWQVLEWVLIITGVFVISKMFASAFSTFIVGSGARNSLAAGLGMIAIGEFSLMMASYVMASPGDTTVVREEMYSIMVLVTTMTALIVPYTIRYTDKITRGLENSLPRSIVYLVSYLNLLFRNIRRRSRSSHKMSNEMRNTTTRLILYAIVMVTAVAFGVGAMPYVDQAAVDLGVNPDVLMVMLVLGVTIVVFFSIIGIWRRTIRLIEIATSDAMLTTRSAENIGYTATSTTLKWTFLAAYVVIGFILLSPMLQSLIEQSVVLFAIILSVVVVAIFALWGSARTIDTKLEEILEERETSPYASSSTDLAEIEDIIAAMESGKH